jgi:hypothetical protein
MKSRRSRRESTINQYLLDDISSWPSCLRGSSVDLVNNADQQDLSCLFKICVLSRSQHTEFTQRSWCAGRRRRSPCSTALFFSNDCRNSWRFFWTRMACARQALRALPAGISTLSATAVRIAKQSILEQHPLHNKGCCADVPNSPFVYPLSIAWQC